MLYRKRYNVLLKKSKGALLDEVFIRPSDNALNATAFFCEGSDFVPHVLKKKILSNSLCYACLFFVCLGLKLSPTVHHEFSSIMDCDSGRSYEVDDLKPDIIENIKKVFASTESGIILRLTTKRKWPMRWVAFFLLFFCVFFGIF